MTDSDLSPVGPNGNTAYAKMIEADRAANRLHRELLDLATSSSNALVCELASRELQVATALCIRLARLVSIFRAELLQNPSAGGQHD
jgi:hypothetical protein